MNGQESNISFPRQKRLNYGVKSLVWRQTLQDTLACTFHRGLTNIAIYEILA
jgi:hypothetical protein